MAIPNHIVDFYPMRELLVKILCIGVLPQRAARIVLLRAGRICSLVLVSTLMPAILCAARRLSIHRAAQDFRAGWCEESGCAASSQNSC